MAYDFRKKGVRYLIEAAAKLKDGVGEGKFGVVVVGSSPSPALRRLIRNLRLETTLVFRGPTKPKRYSGACDVFVLPTFMTPVHWSFLKLWPVFSPQLRPLIMARRGLLQMGWTAQFWMTPEMLKRWQYP